MVVPSVTEPFCHICTGAGVGVGGNIIFGTGRTNRIDGTKQCSGPLPKTKAY